MNDPWHAFCDAINDVHRELGRLKKMADFSDYHRTIDWARSEQQCPDCGEWYPRSHSVEWDAEAQEEHESFCVALMDEAEPLGWEPDYELMRQERLIDEGGE